jgi:hypothetical protein
MHGITVQNLVFSFIVPTVVQEQYAPTSAKPGIDASQLVQVALLFYQIPGLKQVLHDLSHSFN